MLTPTGVKDAQSRTRASHEPIRHSSEKNHRRWKGLFSRRSSGLRVQFMNVEIFSLLNHSLYLYSMEYQNSESGRRSTRILELLLYGLCAIQCQITLEPFEPVCYFAGQ